MPKIGETVCVRPAAAHRERHERVLMTPEAFLPAEGAELPWSAHLEQRLAHGEIEIEQLLAPRALAPGEMLERWPPPPGVVDVGPATIEPSKE